MVPCRVKSGPSGARERVDMAAEDAVGDEDVPIRQRLSAERRASGSTLSVDASGERKGGVTMSEADKDLWFWNGKASPNSFVQPALCPVSLKPDQSLFLIVAGMPLLFNPPHLG
jgi:hypothetical protein